MTPPFDKNFIPRASLLEQLAALKTKLDKRFEAEKQQFADTIDPKWVDTVPTERQDNDKS